MKPAVGILPPVGLGAAGNQNHVAGQILVLGTESVSGPCPEGGTAGLRKTGVHEELGGGVVELIGVHRFDHAQIIGMLVEMGNRIGHPHPRLSILPEGSGGSHQLGSSRSEGEHLALDELVRAVLIRPLDQLGLVVPQVQVRRRSGQMDVNHPLGLGGVMRVSGKQRIPGSFQGEGFRREKLGQSPRAQSHSAVFQKMTPGVELDFFKQWIHGKRKIRFIASSAFRRD